MYEIIRVGIPIRECDITESFINIVNEIKTSPDCIALCTVDYGGDVTKHSEYISSPAGHKILFDNIPFVKFNGKFTANSINTIGFIWQIRQDGGLPREGNFVVNYLLNFLDNHISKYKKVYMFTTGSPHFYDMFTFYIKKVRPVSIIDTCSAITLCSNKMSEITNLPVIDRSYLVDFIDNKNNTIIPNVINLFGAISNNYTPNISMTLIDHFFMNMKKHLSPNDMFYYSYVNNTEVELEIISFQEALNNIEYFSTTDKILTYGVYKNDNSRTI
jgi:hypothetical protein